MGIYVLSAVLGLTFSAWALERVWGHGAGERGSRTPPEVFLGAVLGFALGAKLGFLFAEAPYLLSLPAAQAWSLALQGKTVTGALLFGYLGVEWAKARTSYRHATGDSFALVVPASLLSGRLGCLAAGCCPGIPLGEEAWFAMRDQAGLVRWPAVPMEMAFNLAFLCWAWLVGRRRPSLRGQLFHVYLVAYGLFRFAHEPLRATPRWAAGFSGYQVLALTLVVLGAVRFRQRRQNIPCR